MSSSNINHSINIVDETMPTSTLTETNILLPSTACDVTDVSSSDDSEDEGDQLVYRFRVANPDTPPVSNNEDSKTSTPSTTNDRIKLTHESPIMHISSSETDSTSTKAHQHSQKFVSATQHLETKALPDIPSDSSALLKRRQSKSLDNEEVAPPNTSYSKQPPPSTHVYAISEIVEYQPHHLRASILEPLSMTIKNEHQEKSRDTSIKLDSPKLIIPPAPSYPPPPPSPTLSPPKHKPRSSIKTIPPFNTNDTMIEDASTVDSLAQQHQHIRTSSIDINHNHGIDNTNSASQPGPIASTSVSSPSTVIKNKTDATRNGTSIDSTHHISRYHHASYSLTNNPDAIKLYREMAEKTQDDMTQLTYAKYLLEMAELYQPMMMMAVSKTDDYRYNGHDFGRGNNNDNDNDNDTNKKRETADLRKKKMALEQEGIRWIRRLSKKGVGEAAFLEATWIETEQHGYKMTRISHRIERLYQIAIQAGVPEASYRLALRKEATTKTQLYDIFQLYQKSADLQCVAAIYKMAKIYLHGQLDQEQDFKKGMNYLLSAVRHACITCNEPPYALALILTNKYTKVSIPSELIQTYGGVTKVREYMETSAKLGNIGAKNRLGYFYEHGSYGPMDMSKAFSHYEEAAKQGHHLQSMLGLSRLYNTGCHGPNDHHEQYRLENDTSGWLAAHPRDEDQAFYWCQRAANGGLPDALYLLGWYYEIGFGTPQNDRLSIECYQQASRKGQLDAKDRLAAIN